MQAEAAGYSDEYVEQLRVEIKRLRAGYDARGKTIDAMEESVVDLAADNDRLRAALEWIGDGHITDLVEVMDYARQQVLPTKDTTEYKGAARSEAAPGARGNTDEGARPDTGPGAQDDIAAKYWQLIYAVATKHSGESRHDTALRYINERENAPLRCASNEAVLEKDND
jgi:hypothetical protein